MLLAIDVGNTHAVFGLWDEQDRGWRSIWRRSTDPEATEDELAVWLKGMCDLAGLPFGADGAIIASVVPQMDSHLELLCSKWLHAEPRFVRTGSAVGLRVDYDPPHAVGADRIANALGALAKLPPPIIVVDFGTATTFDSIDANGAYVGGAILPGVHVASQALVQHTAKLPQIDLVAPKNAIGKTTVQSLQSGVMFGYAGAIDALARRIDRELGGKAAIVATGGLGEVFVGLCETIRSYDETLTLDGLVIAHERLSPSD